MKKQLIFYFSNYFFIVLTNCYIIPRKPYYKEEMNLDKDRAEIIAINSLSFVASNEKYLAGYLNLSGSDLDVLKSALQTPETSQNIYASILDYLLQNEKYLIEYCDEYELDPLDINRARKLFPGAMIEG